MTTSAHRLGAAARLTLSGRARQVSFGEDTLIIDLEDGRQLTMPIAWFPRLADADPASGAASRRKRRHADVTQSVTRFVDQRDQTPTSAGARSDSGLAAALRSNGSLYSLTTFSAVTVKRSASSCGENSVSRICCDSGKMESPCG